MKWIKTFEDFNFICTSKSYSNKLKEKEDTEDYEKRRDEIDEEQRELKKSIPAGLELDLSKLEN
ncbi:hypothetical protein DBR32_03390 [Taibaiella sp. KBW10]|uniref:hypothetical protein n=1 Tax=Taibaiella sp. KBW10 TaxID=2153357 RepID=UPI000F5A1621|nr:hypothetical protein [Taibaiella sp. KBW10]RQO32650.1 hypothetical protein DBR32_03390 [Taibaiella sp. KBW10]